MSNVEHILSHTDDSWLIGGGEMGKVVRAMDWGQTPLGPLSSWPQSLRTTVGLCLSSNFPISLAWGPKHIQIYNDGYWPICGAKHPRSMGLDFSECWASAWPVIGKAFEQALRGETSFLENQRMFLDRNGYLEETFFTFSFSPIRDESGCVAGLFHPVTETTSRMIGERRIRMLRELAGRTGKAQTSREALILSAEILSESELDIPFALLYLVESEHEAALIASTESLSKHVASAKIRLDCPDASEWPLAEVIRSNQTKQIEDLYKIFGLFAGGPYPEPPHTALAIPIFLPGRERPVAILVAGISPRLPLDEAYRSFYDLLAASISTSVAHAHVLEEERKRAEKLAELDRAKTAFFSNVSHEFRTPLTLMLGPLEDELAEPPESLTPARRERISVAYRNTLRLLKLVNTLLDFSRLEAGRIQASYEPIDLAAYTMELVSSFRSAVEKAGLKLEADCPCLPEAVYVDRDMWEKIIFNLLSNAFKHTFHGGIAVKLAWLGDRVELSVADTGVGIPESELSHLFDRFHRVKGSKARSHEGTGIGLALVQELAQAHGGVAKVESKEGVGSTFSILIKTGKDHLQANRICAHRDQVSTATRVPAYVEEAMLWLNNAPASTPAAVVSNGAAAPHEKATPSTRYRILWADDNADMREYVRKLLSQLYEVQAVPDGEQALRSALHTPPDLILSDVMMPGLDGFGLIKALRSDLRTRSVPVILLSARAGNEASIEGLEQGADDYLVKPFSARELLARVKTHLELARVRKEFTRDLEAANKELEAFSYSVSHDLRAPLRAINGFSQALLEDYSETLLDDGQRYLNIIRDSAQKMGMLIDDLLAFSRLGRMPLNRQLVSMEKLVRDVLEDLKPLKEAREIDIQLKSIADCYGDPVLLKQVWANILSNALKYTRKRKHAVIEVDSCSVDHKITYTVQDNGAGFNMKYADKLFGVFQRLHRDDEFEGTGVGLAIVQRIVYRHGGAVWAEAELNKGAKFYFSLNL